MGFFKDRIDTKCCLSFKAGFLSDKMAQVLGTNSTIIGASVLVFEVKNGEVKESLKFRKKNGRELKWKWR
jgi:hypothetical protein